MVSIGFLCEPLIFVLDFFEVRYALKNEKKLKEQIKIKPNKEEGNKSSKVTKNKSNCFII